MVISFGYRRGSPPQADLVFDVRDLYNPHRHFPKADGRAPGVQQFVLAGKGKSRVQDIVSQVSQLYRDRGNCHITVAIGCSWGHHRSVAIAECVAEQLGDDVTHRDLPADAPSRIRGCLEDDASFGSGRR